MQLRAKAFLLIINIFVYSNCFSMGTWHVRSAEYEKPKSETIIEKPCIIYSPPSLKMMAALTLIKNGKSKLPAFVPIEIHDYVQFLSQNFNPTGRGFYMQHQVVNNAILNNKYEIIPDIAQILAKCGKIDLLNNAKLPKEHTPLSFAIEKEDLTLVRILLEAGANPNIPWPVSTQSPLMLAVKKENEALVELLIKYKANLEQGSRIDGSTPLMEAASRDQEAIVRILLKNGAKKNAINKNGYCAAILAKNHGHEAVYELVVTPEYLATIEEVKKILGLS